MDGTIEGYRRRKHALDTRAIMLNEADSCNKERDNTNAGAMIIEENG